MPYTQEFKEKVIAESATTSARQLAEKYNVSNGTISNWIKQANTTTQEAVQPQIQAYNSGSSNVGYSNDLTAAFQVKLFENDTVNTGNASNTSLDYSRWANLAYGARTLYMQNGIAATIVDRLVASVVNTGLILQAITDSLEDSKIIEKNFNTIIVAKLLVIRRATNVLSLRTFPNSLRTEIRAKTVIITDESNDIKPMKFTERNLFN